MRRGVLLVVLAIVLVGAGVGAVVATRDDSTKAAPTTSSATSTSSTTTTTEELTNVYRYTQAGMLDESVADVPPRVYVPNNGSDTVTVIDPATFQVIHTIPVGDFPQHVVPSYDMQMLYANNTAGNTLSPIDPRTGDRSGPDIPINDPYNLYFTPDGKFAIVVAERESQLDIRDPVTWQLITSIEIPHSGVNHGDFTADGTTALFSCEFSGWVVRVDMVNHVVTGAVNVGGEPIDVKLSPDGALVYVANHVKNGGGVSIIDWQSMTEVGFVPTGRGAHGLYVSRDGTKLYATNRLAGTVTEIDFATRAKIRDWVIPGGGSPDMGGVSSDGATFWVAGRYNNEVYVFDTVAGTLLQRIRVGSGPHGLAIFPQPGRYSMGHTGNYR